VSFLKNEWIWHYKKNGRFKWIFKKMNGFGTTKERDVLSEFLSIVQEIRLQVMTFMEIFNKILLKTHVFVVNFY